MRLRALGRTGFEISPIGFGGWQIGGPGGAFAWRAQDDSLSVAAVHAALDAGVNWIDTAPAYGSGHSEEIIGRAIRGRSEAPLVFSKCGVVWDDDGRQRFDLEPESLRRQLSDSLRRLQVEAIDLYQVHWPFPETQVDAAWETLDSFRQRGLVRAIGLSNVSVAEVERLQRLAPVASVQLAYSLLDRRAEDELLPHCRRHGIGVLAYSPLQSGLLGGTITHERMAALPPDDWRRRDPQFHEPHLSEYLSFVDCLRPIAAGLGASVAELAVAWTLRDEVVAGAIVGIANADRVAAVAGASSLVLSERALAGIERCAARTLTLPRPAPRFVPDAIQREAAGGARAEQ
jgi:aryl-alcohol dehydrogenase-like predicted oxidoreductase